MASAAPLALPCASPRLILCHVGEVDLDGACLMFNKFGRFVETIFWDNLSAGGIRHYGAPAP